MKRIALALVLVALFLSGCGGDGSRLVVDDGGISTERDVMIYEAAQNTPPQP